MKLTRCVLTGKRLTKPEEAINGLFTYESPNAGKVKIAEEIALSYQQDNNCSHPVLAAICRDSLENMLEPPIIDRHFLGYTLKTFIYPKEFKEKARHFLTWFYNHGGKSFKTIGLDTEEDYLLAYAEDNSEFNRILTYLNEQFWVKWGFKNIYGYGGVYYDVTMTNHGIEEIESQLPNIPMIGLVSQGIATGNVVIDEKINHAKKLFFDEPQTMEHMRSACVTLAAVLEPIRNDLTKVIASPDVEAFFQLVNNFDIRHNNHKVKSLEYPEQLEWVFYSLLNTVNVYYKLKIKLA